MITSQSIKEFLAERDRNAVLIRTDAKTGKALTKAFARYRQHQIEKQNHLNSIAKTLKQ